MVVMNQSGLFSAEESVPASPSIEELAASQGTRPLTDASKMAGVISDAEIADFVALIYTARERA
jgi:hypothetical protein